MIDSRAGGDKEKRGKLQGDKKERVKKEEGIETHHKWKRFLFHYKYRHFTYKCKTWSCND